MKIDAFHSPLRLLAIIAVAFAAAASPDISHDWGVLVAADELQSPNARISIQEVQVGLAKTWKIGFPTPIRVTVNTEDESFQGKLEIQVVDNEGIGVVHSARCEVSGRADATISLLMMHGRSSRSVEVRIVDEAGRIQSRETIATRPSPDCLPADQPWVLGIGHDLGLDQAANQFNQSLLPSYSTCELHDASELPRDAAAYRGVDLLVISTADESLLNQIEKTQSEAIVEWCKQGGHVLLWLGGDTRRLEASASWLVELAGAEAMGNAAQIDPALLESYLASQKRLEPISMGLWEPRDARIDLSLQTPDRKKYPLLFRRVHGLGEVHVCAMDLDRQPLVDWADRKLLLERLLKEHLDVAGGYRDTSTRRVIAATRIYPAKSMRPSILLIRYGSAVWH